MAINVRQVLVQLEGMTVTELKRKYADVHGELTRCNNRQYLIRRIAWRTQALEEGGLSERARERAMALANDADLRLKAPGEQLTALPIEDGLNTVAGAIEVSQDDRLPMPGALLTRQYKGRTIKVRVLPKGFDYDGRVYRSLSAVAQAVTGSHWNGYYFFGITPPKQHAKESAA